MTSPRVSASGVCALRTIVSALALASTIACHNRTSVGSSLAAEDSIGARHGTRSGKHAGKTVQSISVSELTSKNVRRVEELLAGRVAGVRVIPTPNGGFTIRIRGISTLRENTEPLYVIDGMVLTLMPGEGLNWLDPAQIERIDVLKEPVETSMYGARGANGVILIKTKGSP